MPKIRWEDSADWDSSRSESGLNHEPGQYLDSNPGKVQQGYQHKPLKRGLVGWWPLHTESGVANDLSGNGNDGTHNGTTRGVAGKGGLQATSFDGSNDEVLVSNSDFSWPDRFTVSLWLRPSSDSQNKARIYDKAKGAQNEGHQLKVSSGEYTFQYNGSRSISTGVSPQKSWTHIVFRQDGSTAQAFINGEKKSDVSISGTTINVSRNLHIMNDSFGGGNYTAGALNNFRVYRRSLSDSEVQTLYEWGSETGLTDKRLHQGTGFEAVSRYRLDEDPTDFWSNNGGSASGISFVEDSVRGQAASFDGGTGDAVQVPDNNALDFGSSGTVSAWFKTTDTSSIQTHRNRMVIKRRDGVNPRRGWFISAGYGGGIGAIFEDSSDTQLRLDNGRSGHGFYAGGNWHHVVLVKNRNTGTLYANGEVVEKNTNSSIGDVTNSRDMYIGQTDPSDGNHPDAFHGQIDDVRIFNEALSAKKVRELYRWGTKGINMTEKTVMQ